VVDEVSEILSLCREVPFEVVDSGSLIESAIQIALEMDRTVYDSVYLALAVERDCVMVTADRRLVNAIQTSSWGRFVIDLADT
jgi:predicted nucleic acid-binding protein